MEPIEWLILLQTVVLLLIALFLYLLISKAIVLLDTLNKKIIDIESEVTPLVREVRETVKKIEPMASELLDTVNNTVRSIDEEVKPVLGNIDQTLSNLEPLTRELGERNQEIAGILSNIERVTDDAQATTGAIRQGIVPFGHMLAGLLAGFSEGKKRLTQLLTSNSNEDNYDL